MTNPATSSPAPSFAELFGRLLSQRVREPNNVDAHRATLDELATLARGSIKLVWDNWRLHDGSCAHTAASPAILDLLSRMAAHGVKELSFADCTNRSHLLGVVWILSQEPKLGDGGANALSRLRTLGAPTVGMVTVSNGGTAPPAPITVTNTANNQAEAEQGALEPLVFDATAHAAHADTALPLVATLAAANAPDEVARALAAIAAFAERPNRVIDDVVSMLAGLMDAQQRLRDPEARAVLDAGRRRIARPHFFRAVAAAMSESPGKHDLYMRIFAHYGDAAVDEVIEQLARAESSKERRVLFDALVELKRGVPTLIYLLGDGRWYVVRNAAELLGEMKATEAEPGLAWLLSHADQRVRQSATSALAKLETPGARAALKQAIRDESREVRLHAMIALAATKERGAVPIILRALSEEADPDVQRTLMATLAQIGTPEAVQHLVDVAEPPAGLFKKKPTPLRVAAVEALADSKAPRAVEVVRALTRDREPQVREAALNALKPGRISQPVLALSRVSW